MIENTETQELTNAEDSELRSCMLWSGAGCYLSSFGAALLCALPFLENDDHKMLKLGVGIALLLSGGALISAGVLLAKYGSFANKPQEPEESSESLTEVSEVTPIFAVANRM